MLKKYTLISSIILLMLVATVIGVGMATTPQLATGETHSLINYMWSGINYMWSGINYMWSGVNYLWSG